MASSSAPTWTRGPLSRTPEVPTPPRIPIRYFYTSPLAIDDPLSPLPPPPSSGAATVARQAPRPFSAFDNKALEKDWLDVRRKLRLRTESAKAASIRSEAEKRDQRSRAGTAASTQLTALRKKSYGSDASAPSPRIGPRKIPGDGTKRHSLVDERGEEGSKASSVQKHEMGDGIFPPMDTTSTTGNPFIRAPDRTDGTDLLGTSSKSRSNSVRPTTRMMDSYNWGEDTFGAPESPSRNESRAREQLPTDKAENPAAKVPVGVSRLHSVTFPDFQMEPIYWNPVRDIAPVQRGTWFYADTMMPVETDVSNLLEAGYIEMQAWTDTWADELNSAIEVGAAGEMKIVHKLWPDKPKNKAASRPGTAVTNSPQLGTMMEPAVDDPEKERQETANMAGDMIDIACGSHGPDNRAAGTSLWGRDGNVRMYRTAGVIYSNEKTAYILRPSLLPSAYYNRRPLANYIRKNKAVGIRVVRGFNEQIWDRLYPPQKSAKLRKAREGVSSAEDGVSVENRQHTDPELAQSDRPEVTDLVLVIHGIGQKLSERVESYHFTHSINSLRRDANVELGDDLVKMNLRRDMGGIMMLPVNWRLTLSFEDGGYKDDNAATANDFALADITPETLPSVRNIVSDVMLDIPYYLTTGYHDKMVAAVCREANRIYYLWCQNNPGFAENGRVHLIAHSLGSVMAVDILSNQPTRVKFGKPIASLSLDDLPTSHFAFDTSNLFMAGSPAGFFLLLKRSGLIPRRGRSKPGDEDFTSDTTPGVTGEQGTYGCLAVDNIYNVVNGYDPVAYCLNATVDADYAAALKPAAVPSRSTSWFGSFGRRRPAPAVTPLNMPKPSLTNRLPSNVEMETHDFSREEIAERKAYLLNDNGQIDYFLKYGGGPLEIQYLTMLGAHSSYWINKDFVRMLVCEIGRAAGRAGTLEHMRAVKKQKVVGLK